MADFLVEENLFVEFWEEELDLFQGVLVAVRPVGSVPGVGQPELAPDSFRILEASLDDFGWPHQASPIGNRIGLGQDVGVASTRAHVCHQSIVEEFPLVFCVEPLRICPGQVDEL